MKYLLVILIGFVCLLTGARAQVVTVTPDPTWTNLIYPALAFQEPSSVAFVGSQGNAAANWYGTYAYGYFSGISFSDSGQTFVQQPDGVNLSKVPGASSWYSEGTNALGEIKLIRLYLEYIGHCFGYLLGLILVFLSNHAWEAAVNV